MGTLPPLWLLSAPPGNSTPDSRWVPGSGGWCPLSLLPDRPLPCGSLQPAAAEDDACWPRARLPSATENRRLASSSSPRSRSPEPRLQHQGAQQYWVLLRPPAAPRPAPTARDSAGRLGEGAGARGPGVWASRALVLSALTLTCGPWWGTVPLWALGIPSVKRRWGPLPIHWVLEGAATARQPHTPMLGKRSWGRVHSNRPWGGEELRPSGKVGVERASHVGPCVSRGRGRAEAGMLWVRCDG